MAEEITKCSLCGKEFNFFDHQEDYTIDKVLGYGSKYDGEHLRLHICCGCMDTIIEQSMLNPLKD